MNILSDIIQKADQELATSAFNDYPGACNGLQITNDGHVGRIASAVDAHEITLQKAVEAKADLLIVHHGLFWGHSPALTGANYRKIKLCLDNNLAVYSSHLPLDAHPKLGNNAVIARRLGFKNVKPFYETQGQSIGFRAETNTTRDALFSQVNDLVGGGARLIAGGREEVRQVGIVSGSAGNFEEVCKAGVDTYITGEMFHHLFGQAYEFGLNIIAGGHYQTEVFGVKALAEFLAKEFKLPWTFLDTPTGM